MNKGIRRVLIIVCFCILKSKMHVYKCISLGEGRTYPLNCGGEGEPFLKPLWYLEVVHCFVVGKFRYKEPFRQNM